MFKERRQRTVAGAAVGKREPPRRMYRMICIIPQEKYNQTHNQHTQSNTATRDGTRCHRRRRVGHIYTRYDYYAGQDCWAISATESPLFAWLKMWHKWGRPPGSARHIWHVPFLTLLEPQTRFGDKPLKFQVACPQNGTAARKGLRG